jgi:hypothetical protein
MEKRHSRSTALTHVLVGKPDATSPGPALVRRIPISDYMTARSSPDSVEWAKSLLRREPADSRQLIVPTGFGGQGAKRAFADPTEPFLGIDRPANLATRSAEEVTMAEINKLSVSKVLDKLRGNDAPKTAKTSRLDKKIKTTDEEIQRLRAASVRFKRGQRAGTTGHD